ncbi:MAG TPA: hypothetical protein VJV05_05350 [Pyrinomonadaceae bacterium]|nr:hypothetical protein [Pyrinomonadaceae bacterium]
MKQIAKILIIAVMLYSTACVPSVNPFCNEADVYMDTNLLGTWSDEDGSQTWTFVYGDDSRYLLTYTDDAGKTGAFTARLFKVGDKSFLDIEPFRPQGRGNGFYNEHLLSMHSVYLISIEGKKGHLAFLDPEFIEATLQNDPAALDHAVVDDEIVLTATTEKLKAFLLSSANRPGAFVMSETIERKK